MKEKIEKMLTELKEEKERTLQEYYESPIYDDADLWAQHKYIAGKIDALSDLLKEL